MSKRITKQYTGGWIDTSIRPQALKLIKQASNDESLAERIGNLLGDYRLWKAYQDTAPAPAETVRHSKKIVRDIDVLLTDLDLMPEDVKALVTENLVELTGEYDLHTTRISKDLMRFRAACNAAINSVRQLPAKRGEKSKYLEYKLLSDVSYLLEPHITGKQNAAAKAAEILTAAGVHHLFAEAKKLRKIIVSVRK